MKVTILISEVQMLQPVKYPFSSNVFVLRRYFGFFRQRYGNVVSFNEVIVTKKKK